MLSSGCDDRECHVRIGYAIVQVCDVRKHRVPAWGIQMELLRIAMPAWGIRMELLRIAMRAPCHQGEGYLHHAHADGPPCDVTSSPDIPHPEFCPGDVTPSPDVSHPADISGWERRAFQLPWSDISGSTDSAHPESFIADATHGSLALKAYQQNLYLEYYY